jgi:hypothetical protein
LRGKAAAEQQRPTHKGCLRKVDEDGIILPV